MECNNCGNKLNKSDHFCPVCGTRVSVKTTEYNKNAFSRRAEAICEKWDIYPDLQNVASDRIADFNVDYLSGYNPLYRLDELKNYLYDTLMEETGYAYDRTEFDEIIKEVYQKKETDFQKRILRWLIDSAQNYIDYTRFDYSDLIYLRRDESCIFTYSYCITVISQKIGVYEYLPFARMLLKSLDLFHCEKGTTKTAFDIKSSGMLGELPQFRADKHLQLKWISLIENIVKSSKDESVIQSLNKQIEQEKSEAKKKNKKATTLLTAKIISTILAMPLILIFTAVSDKLFGEIYFDNTISEIGIGVACLIFISTLAVINIKGKNPIVVALMVLLASVLFCPLVILICYSIELAILAIVIIVVGLFLFIKS